MVRLAGWLCAAVLGANDEIVSTASLIVSVAAAHTAHGNTLLTGVAGLVAGAMATATGEYVSLSTPSDTEKAALTGEKSELVDDFQSERREFTAIYA